MILFCISRARTGVRRALRPRDVGALSYNYVVENQFFAGLLAFQWIYYDDRFFGLIRQSKVVELGFVFLPYMPFIRFRWPVSSFRDGLNASEGHALVHEFFPPEGLCPLDQEGAARVRPAAPSRCSMERAPSIGARRVHVGS